MKNIAPHRTGQPKRLAPWFLVIVLGFLPLIGLSVLPTSAMNIAEVDGVWSITPTSTPAASGTFTSPGSTFTLGPSAFSWVQTDWSGGSGQDAWHDARRYDAGNGVHVYTVGEVTLGYTAPAGGTLTNLSQDGFPDLIIGKNRYGTSLLCHGCTDGFAMQRCQPLAFRGCGPIWADFNNDGFFDIALMGDVDGSFQHLWIGIRLQRKRSSSGCRE